MEVAGAAERHVDQVLDVGRFVVAGKRRRITVEQRVRLERQVIEGKVLRREFERGSEIAACVVERLPRQRVHQIKIDVVEDRQCRFRRAACLGGIVNATQRLQMPRVEALDAE